MSSRVIGKNGNVYMPEDIQKMDAEAEAATLRKNEEDARQAVSEGLPLVAANRLFNTDIKAE